MTYLASITKASGLFHDFFLGVGKVNYIGASASFSDFYNVVINLTLRKNKR